MVLPVGSAEGFLGLMSRWVDLEINMDGREGSLWEACRWKRAA